MKSAERFRQVHPSLIAAAHLARALIFETKGDHRTASARYDSALAHFERIIGTNPQSAYISVFHSDLGLAQAGLGRCEEAIRQGTAAVQLLPITKDAFMGGGLLKNLAEIYVTCDGHEEAIEQLELLLSVHSSFSQGLLRVDPIWNPLRENPRFQQLLEINRN